MLEFLRDIFASFRQTSLERVKSPFLGAFVFSWIGFNWQMLAILFFSKNSIEERLKFINSNFDVWNYLSAPLCTSALIAFLLPQINKAITKIQDKPNSETIELTLSSKIRVAELQQSIAEIEARKKLADKKEERYIEESISLIKAENKKLHELVLAFEIEVKELQIKLSDSKAEESSLKAQLRSEKDSLEQSESARKKLSELNINLNSTIKELDYERMQASHSILKLEEEIGKLQTDFENLNELKNTLTSQITNLSNLYPGIFRNHLVNGVPHIALTEKATKGLPNINRTMIMDNIKNALKKKEPGAEDLIEDI
ncbi:hypothetical protein [Enterobacter asburiae]|uniref:hypothetical protein n=1 Tax=Enterobacter asburiae TaxID=61645 RepID=UPI000B417F20|nr:hypothetical protein [Enterobacter asburiae]RNV98867.1 hypothetical protein CAF89_012925 [Enterobacter asburiae]